MMIDIETLGNGPNALIVQVGVVVFNCADIISADQYAISINDSLRHGRQVDAEALNFWLTRTSDEQRRNLFKGHQVTLGEALTCIQHIFQSSECEHIWSYGANYDVPILNSAYWAIFNKPGPWKFWNVRCVRTYLEVAELSINQVVQTEHGPAHMAVVDAHRQAEAIIRANLKLKDKAYGNPMRFSAMPLV